MPWCLFSSRTSATIMMVKASRCVSELYQRKVRILSVICDKPPTDFFLCQAAHILSVSCKIWLYKYKCCCHHRKKCLSKIQMHSNINSVYLTTQYIAIQWASCQIRVIAGAHAPGMPGTFSPSPQVSDPDMHHGTCVTHVPWCMPGSLTSSFLWNRRRGETFPAFPAHAPPAILRIW